MSESVFSIILNVDDNEALRYAKTRVLKAAGFTVFEAGTGQEGLELMRRVHPHLALLDVKLPDMNGIDLARIIKSDPIFGHTLVLQTSATFVDGDDRVRALEGGADSYLVEPVEPAELIANINALLRLRRAEDKVRESERLLRLATTAAKLHTWSITLDEAHPLSAARLAEEAMLPPGNEADANSLALHVHLDDVKQLEDALRAALAGEMQYDAEYRLVGDSTVRWISSRGTVLSDRLGKPGQLIGVAQDVTERKLGEMERERLLRREQAARMEAEEATRLKDEFLATVSHELRTPLNAITGWVHLMRRGKLSQTDMERGLETIHRNANSQSRLINDLLDVSRIINGQLRLDMRPVALPAVIGSAIDSVRPIAAAKSISLHCSLDAEVESVTGDPERLQQVVCNLLTNAVKFSDQGGDVRVDLRRAGDRIALTVSDSGAGIAPDFLPYVFHPFRQAESTTTRRHPGLGLGLAIARHLVELHGGSVSAASAGEGQGATFCVILPGKGIADDGPRRWHGDDGASLAAGSLDGVRVLIVDDEPDARDMLAAMLRQTGATVSEAGSAAHALALLGRETFDVLISDIGMPGEDGYSFIRSIRRRKADAVARIPAAALTAYAGSEDRQRALAAGFQIHITKPVRPAELMSAVGSLAGRAMST
jgi:signal transduction histidine kinase